MVVTATAGHARALGATIEGGGVNFAVFSENATQVFVCLFDENGAETRIALPECDGGIWHGHVSGVGAGQLYGLRADGPYAPMAGHRFNVNKLLIDPYARALTGHPEWNDALYGYDREDARRDLSFDARDSADWMPRCVVSAEPGAGRAEHPRHALSDTIIYEAHVKGLTAAHPEVAAKGRFSGLSEPAVIDHLLGLGVTAIELLPIHAFINDRFLVDGGRTNYWGYQSIGFFAPDPRYLSAGDVMEVRAVVDRLHEAGIEVILDVVYNHSGEGDELGPTLAFRGLDNASYYRLKPDGRHYVNDTGTGNTLNLEHPMVLRMVLDSLRYWVEVMGVDGFRFDLAAVLGRTAREFDPRAGFFQAVRQDPVLAGVKLIAEPWDIGPGGYQLGSFPSPFLEWNDRFRDGVRRFWRRDAGLVADIAGRLTGSARRFDHSRRAATSSVNFLTAHDGMTLADLTRYSRKHNEANGEGGKDGHSEDFSDNFGIEGPSEHVSVEAARTRRRRAMLATMMLAQGTPMLLAGDELGNTQGGNNNAYNQDNETSWIDWEGADQEFLGFVRRVIALRKAHPVLRQKLFLHSRERATDGVEDLFWWRGDGRPMQTADWHDPLRKLLGVEMRTAAETPDYAALEYSVLMIFNAGDATRFALPPAPEGQRWCQELNTAEPASSPRVVDSDEIEIEAQSVSALVLVPEA